MARCATEPVPVEFARSSYSIRSSIRNGMVGVGVMVDPGRMLRALPVPDKWIVGQLAASQAGARAGEAEADVAVFCDQAGFESRDEPRFQRWPWHLTVAGFRYRRESRNG